MRALVCTQLLGAGCLAQVTPLTPLRDAGSVSGTDGGPSPCARLDTPQTVDFGGVPVQTLASQAVILTNCSTLDLAVTASEVAGAQAALFKTDKPAGTAFTLPAGESVSMVVTYAPVMPSSLDTAHLTLELDTGGMVLVDLQGHGL